MGCGASESECSRIGPDYFGLFASEVAELFSQSEDFLPFSDKIFDKTGKVNHNAKENFSSVNSYDTSSLFSDCFGSHISDFRKERLKLLLRQSIAALSREVDEIMDPVFAVCQLRSCLMYKESLLADATPESYQEHRPQKKLKAITFPGSETGDLSVSLPGGNMSNEVVKHHEGRHAKESGPRNGQNELGANVGAAPKDEDVQNDLQFLLQNDSSKVQGVMKKHCDELLATLGYMEDKLEGLLDVVVSNCRLMTLAEKQHLRRLIRDLPPRNLDRVVEIFCRVKQVEKHSCNEMHVDLEKEDKATLWRLYFYIETVKNAKRLCGV